MTKNLLAFFICIILLPCCGRKTPEEQPVTNEDVPDVSPAAYMSLYDPVADAGQYTLPEMKVVPPKYWSCVDVLEASSRNDPDRSAHGEGLQYHLLCQSIAGLVNAAVDEGRAQIAVWLYDHGHRDSYELSKKALDNLGMNEQGLQTGLELALNDYNDADGVKIQLKGLFDGYVLTDLKNNPESNLVATVASHVYNSIIVDVRDRELFDKAGYKMTYDARTKSTAEAWYEFKDRCSNAALVVMPVLTGELRQFVIKNKLFALNINKVADNPSQGQNLDIFEEALSWLAPGARAYGWEGNVAEDVFVNRASLTGHPWVPADWYYNLPLTSINYGARQKQTLVKVQHPKNIDFDKKKRFVAYWLTDGDNVQWMMNDFVRNYYSDKHSAEVKMGYGVALHNLSLMAPEQHKNIIDAQLQECTLIEALGGGYLYADNFGQYDMRSDRLDKLASDVAASMRQHRVKILGLMCRDVGSAAAKDGYRAFIEANDQLEGIVVVQYSPMYASGEGEIFWFKNSAGFQIPVVTVKYTIWNHEGNNVSRQGSPAFVFGKLKSEAENSYSLVSVHAWSRFHDIGNSGDVTAELANGGNIYGTSAAWLCSRRFDTSMETISVQELIWRIRMKFYPQQTTALIESYTD